MVFQIGNIYINGEYRIYFELFMILGEGSIKEGASWQCEWSWQIGL